MMKTKKQMRMFSRHFKEDTDVLIKTAKSVGISDPGQFLKLTMDAGLNAKGVEAMMLMECGNPNNVDVVDAYSRIVSSSEAISEMRGTKDWRGIVFDTNRAKQKIRQLLNRKDVKINWYDDRKGGIAADGMDACLTQTNNKRRTNMKVTIDGKRYDTSKCEVLGEIKHGDHLGISRLIRASDGKLLYWSDPNSNGQEIGLRSYVLEWDNYLRKIDDFTLTDKQEARCASLGLIEIVD